MTHYEHQEYRAEDGSVNDQDGQGCKDLLRGSGFDFQTELALLVCLQGRQCARAK